MTFQEREAFPSTVSHSFLLNSLFSVSPFFTPYICHVQKLICSLQDLICPHSSHKTLQPQPRLFLELVHQTKYLHVLNFTVSHGIWSILMLFFKTVLTVEHIELQKPFYFNKKEIFLLFTLLWTKDWSQFLSVLSTCIFTWFYSMSFFFFFKPHLFILCGYIFKCHLMQYKVLFPVDWRPRNLSY